MRRSQGLKKVLLMACAMAVAVAFVLPAVDASAFSESIGTKISLVKPGKLYKIVSKPAPPAQPSGLFSLPGGNLAAVGGSVAVTLDGNSLDCALSAGGLWKGLGNPVGSKGWKYVNTAPTPSNPCSLVLIKEKVIKVIAKNTGSLAVGSTNGELSLQLVAGADGYCALATPPHFLTKAGILLKMKDEPAPAECIICAGETYTFTTGLPTGGTAGTLSNHRCSNYSSGACADNADCDYGTCFMTPPVCSGNTSVLCDDNGDCLGTCGEVSSGNLPMDLAEAALYTGGGLNSVPLPLPVPDRGRSVMTLAGGALGPTSPSCVGDRHCTKGRTCSVGGAPCVVDQIGRASCRERV